MIKAWREWWRRWRGERDEEAEREKKRRRLFLRMMTITGAKVLAKRTQ